MRYLLANWKMNTTVPEAVALLEQIQDGLRTREGRGVPLPLAVVCPPFVSLVPMAEVLDRRLVRLGAQNCHWDTGGPYTGEVAAQMLRGLCDYVLVGHSERAAAGETDEEVARKVAAAGAAGLVPFVFAGEDEPGPTAAADTERRLRRRLASVDLSEQPVVVVYEPKWAVGAAQPADPPYVDGVVRHLKGAMADLGAGEPVVVYGGAVAGDNVERFAVLDVLDGVGATRATLDAGSFLTMVDRITATRSAGGPS